MISCTRIQITNYKYSSWPAHERFMIPNILINWDFSSSSNFQTVEYNSHHDGVAKLCPGMGQQNSPKLLLIGSPALSVTIASFGFHNSYSNILAVFFLLLLFFFLIFLTTVTVENNLLNSVWEWICDFGGHRGTTITRTFLKVLAIKSLITPGPTTTTGATSPWINCVWLISS